MWTLSFGIAWFGGGGVGVSGNFTITISYSREKGFQIGATTTNGGGSVVGAGGSVGVVISVTNAPDINSLTGASLVIGGSVGEGLIGGGEISIPTDLECGYAQISGSFGLGIGSFAEGHTHITYTRTWEWWTSRGKDVGRDE